MTQWGAQIRHRPRGPPINRTSPSPRRCCHLASSPNARFLTGGLAHPINNTNHHKMMLSSGLEALCDLAQRCSPSTALPSLSSFTKHTALPAPDGFLRRDPLLMNVRPEFASSPISAQSPICREPSPVIPGVVGPLSPPSVVSTAAGSASNSDSESASTKQAHKEQQQQQALKNAQAKAARQLLSIKLPTGKVGSSLEPLLISLISHRSADASRLIRPTSSANGVVSPTPPSGGADPMDATLSAMPVCAISLTHLDVDTHPFQAASAIRRSKRSSVPPCSTIRHRRPFCRPQQHPRSPF